MKVLKGNPLDAHDKFSFEHPPIHSEEDWRSFLENIFSTAEEFASLIEQMPEEKLWETMAEAKYGTWYSNLQGIIEHTHYHLGQVALIKKIIRGGEK